MTPNLAHGLNNFDFDSDFLSDFSCAFSLFLFIVIIITVIPTICDFFLDFFIHIRDFLKFVKKLSGIFYHLKNSSFHSGDIFS